MNPANDGVDLRNAGDIDRLTHGIHDTGMPRGRNDHQPDLPRKRGFAALTRPE